MKKIISSIMLSLIVFNVSYADTTKEVKTLVFNAGYAFQAGLLCDNLMYRVDTSKRVSQKIGVDDIRGGSYKDIFNKGTDKAFKDMLSTSKKEMCSKAWKLFGCNGTRVKRLLSESVRYYTNPTICPYR